jgi:hypothetical protein
MTDGRRHAALRHGHAMLVAVTVLVAGCQLGAAPATPPRTQGLGVSGQDELDPDSPCVIDPDPANGGHPLPPAVVVAAGDPTDPTGVVEIIPVGVGDLVLPSDRLLAADLFAMAVNPAALPAVDLGGVSGRFPVCLHVARLDPADERVALLHVKLSVDPVVSWTEEPIGFGVDGGTGGIGSSEAVAAATADIDYLTALEAHDVPTWSWTNIITDRATGANVIGFSTGYGDGGYPVFTGLAKDGRAASVVIDLFVVPWRWFGRVGPIGEPRSSVVHRPGQALSPRAANNSS